MTTHSTYNANYHNIAPIMIAGQSCPTFAQSMHAARYRSQNVTFLFTQ